MRKRKGIFGSIVAVTLCAVMMVSSVACTSADITKTVNLIVAELPAVASAAQAVVAIVGAFGATKAGNLSNLNADIQSELDQLNQLCQAYLANPQNTTYQNIEAVIDKMVSETDTFLAALHISDPQSKLEATAVLAGLSTVLHILDGYVISTMSAKQARARAASRRVKLSSLQFILDRQKLDAAARGQGMNYQDVMTYETSLGF